VKLHAIRILIGKVRYHRTEAPISSSLYWWVEV